jgi:hypothetical protein
LISAFRLTITPELMQALRLARVKIVFIVEPAEINGKARCVFATLEAIPKRQP